MNEQEIINILGNMFTKSKIIAENISDRIFVKNAYIHITGIGKGYISVSCKYFDQSGGDQIEFSFPTVMLFSRDIDRDCEYYANGFLENKRKEELKEYERKKRIQEGEDKFKYEQLKKKFE